jgi:hypothetical protein
MIHRLTALLCLIFILASCQDTKYNPSRKTIKLSGSWKFAMDSSGIGIQEKWFSKLLTDSVILPGTMDENHKGIVNKNRMETMRLSRELMYDGMAWYQKAISIPEDWKDKSICLKMERTKPTQVWVDETLIGSNNNLLTPQEYDLSAFLSPGKHQLTILVNNGPDALPKGVFGAHALTEHTQTNWNGIIGEFQLEASSATHIENVQIYPDIKNKKAVIKLSVVNPDEKLKEATIRIVASTWNADVPKNLKRKSFQVKLIQGENPLEFIYELGNDAAFWSEFSPTLYKLSISLENKVVIDNCQIDFGLRQFKTEGTQFSINGIKTFLRGKNDACVFPLTGHPPMDTESWIRVFKIAKTYGINHYRFHTWTPPLAAFKAADIEGIYLSPELPYWGSMDQKNQDLNAFLLKEGTQISKAYGNNPSFVMFSLGNELSGELSVMQDFAKQFKQRDDRHLISFGSNNYLGWKGQVEGEDYLVTCRVGAEKDSTFSSHVRASFSFADAWQGGIVNGEYPSTKTSYQNAISKSTVPVVGHEIAQYQVYPNYDELKKYTGVLKPWNLEIFRKRLEGNQMSDQALDFFKASGALSAICYRADIEMALRTPEFGGFQLLDLQDFPGQGTALVGLLDAFMDSKGLITPESFREFCNQVVPLFRMDKYCWTNAETFTGQIQVANYSAKELNNQSVNWELRNSHGEIIDQNSATTTIFQGGLTDISKLNIDLKGVQTAQKLSLTISLPGTTYKNTYPLWVYPENPDTNSNSEVLISSELDIKTLRLLANGQTVLLVPDHETLKDVTVGGLFTPDYWNYRMFKGISEWAKKPVSPGTLSILTNPEHPLFKDFPTEFHSNWQWWTIVKNSRPFILDKTQASYRPIVQVVDNVERNYKLGLIFEFAVGKGKLLVCMAKLSKIQDKPEGRQFYSCILRYLKSKQFDPQTSISEAELVSLFKTQARSQNISGVKNISYQ